MLRWTFWNPAHPSFSARIVFEPTFLAVLPREASAGRWPMRKPRFAARFCTTSDWFPLIGATIGFEVDGADAARDFCTKHQVSPQRADLVWMAIALHTSPEIRTVGRRDSAGPSRRRPRLSGSGPDQVPPQVLEEIFEKYPRMKFKAEFRNLLVEHCQHNPAAQVLTWTDDVARTAGCTLHGSPSQRHHKSWRQRRLTNDPNVTAPRDAIPSTGRLGKFNDPRRLRNGETHMIRVLNVEHHEHVSEHSFEDVMRAVYDVTGSIEEGFGQVREDRPFAGGV